MSLLTFASVIFKMFVLILFGGFIYVYLSEMMYVDASEDRALRQETSMLVASVDKMNMWK